MEAQNAVRDLQTKLAHERMAKDEAIRRVEAERQTIQQTLQSVQAVLEAEREARALAEQRAVEAARRCREAEQRVRADFGQQQMPYVGRPRGRPRKIVAAAESMASTGVLALDVEESAEESAAGECADAAETVATMTPPPVETGQPPEVRRRGRPPKVREPESEFVEWWKPGWKSRLP